MPEHDQMNDDPRPEDISAAADADMAALMDKMGAMEAELEAAKGRAVRVMADFQNFQRRAAQNEQAARQSGVSAKIVSTSSAKPIFSISSASSRTRKRNSDRSSVRFSRWSMMRPGVPTTM